jgi:hypothetical protein
MIPPTKTAGLLCEKTRLDTKLETDIETLRMMKATSYGALLRALGFVCKDSDTDVNDPPGQPGGTQTFRRAR